VAVTANCLLLPGHAVAFVGCVTNLCVGVTVSLPPADTAEGVHVPLTTQRNSACCIARSVAMISISDSVTRSKVALFTRLAQAAPLLYDTCHWYVFPVPPAITSNEAP